MGLKFTKMQAYGNDYVYIDAIHQTVTDPNALARRVSERHFGIGSDGLVLPAAEEGVRLHDGPPAAAVGIIVHLVLLIHSVVPYLVAVDADVAPVLGPAQNGLVQHI